ncbi:MAG: glycosyltransferase [Actinomycetota bacterium]|nr:glycosyltransferase [Actinomycetota bacterium]
MEPARGVAGQRPLRVLHVGNIANNAYLLAKAQREVGIDALVASPHFTHVMGFPEWEEASFSIAGDQHFRGPITDVPFTSPDWFLAGSWGEIASKVGERWDPGVTPDVGGPTRIRSRMGSAFYRAWPHLRGLVVSVVPASAKPWLASSVLYWLKDSISSKADISRAVNLADILHVYGPSAGILDHVPPGVPIVATEHGTLRDFIWADLPAARATSRGFKRADRVIVTNQDCLEPALRLGIPPEHVLKSPHPTTPGPLHQARNRRSTRLERASSGAPTILIPARHTRPNPVDVGKGTSEILHCVVTLAERRPDIVFQFIDWGDFTHGSRRYLAHAGLAPRVEWLPLLSRPLLQEYMADATLVIDQLRAPAYGGLTADCLGVGVPVVTAHSCEIDTAFFGGCAPVRPAMSADEAVEAAMALLDPAFDPVDHGRVSTAWHDEHLSSDLALAASLAAYSDLAPSGAYVYPAGPGRSA